MTRLRDMLGWKWIFIGALCLVLGSTPLIAETLDEAVLRAGGTIQLISMPDNLVPGTTNTIQWEVLSYVPLRSAIRIRLPSRASVVLNGTLTGVRDGPWFINTELSQIYSFEREWVVPNTPGTCKIRFINARDDGIYWMNGNLPGEVDSRPYRTDGKIFLRDIVSGETSPEIISEDLTMVEPYFDTLDLAVLRAGGVCTLIDMPDNLIPGQVVTSKWEILAYTNIRSKLVIEAPTWGQGSIEAVLVGQVPGRWRVSTPIGLQHINETSDRSSKLFKFEIEWEVPNDPGTCRMRFWFAQEDGNWWMNANLPSGVDSRPFDTDGKEFLRDILAP